MTKNINLYKFFYYKKTTLLICVNSIFISIRITIFYFFLFFMTSLSVFASAEKVDSEQFRMGSLRQQDMVLKSISTELDLIKSQLNSNVKKSDTTIHQIDEKIEERVHALHERLELIESKLDAYKSNLKDFERDGINNNLGMNFSIWTGILLASVAAIVTTLGVVIAIGSVFGYKKIMDSSRKEAERVAKGEANKVAKEEISERINRGEFNALVMDAVDRVAFGNINSNDEFDRKGD
ncbi:hypothetical protein [Pectobacterium brasiliense]|uniref:hypothetical protein n=1 Tax=Pectobacterium brasiliense TaxID=180957 RepID=UPI0019696339|nr:hypothetical protein [Pectobacterium brasiliense]MBN3160312.1 hypothetical protein [Pectobacterium brasiliense]